MRPSLFAAGAGWRRARTPVTVPRAYAESAAATRSAIAPPTASRCFTTCCGASCRANAGSRHRALPIRPSRGSTTMRATCARDIHKMHAFLRFRPRQIDGQALYTAWFEPQHYILRRAVPFFVDRFTNMDWLIATPHRDRLWRGGELAYGPPCRKARDRGATMSSMTCGLTYYRTTFNPARLRLKAMATDMPRHYWPNMPETAVIPAMVATASARVAAMRENAPDQPELFAERIAARGRPQPDIPRTPVAELRLEASVCQRCPLLQTGDADGVRRRSGKRANHIRRRAAGRSGRSRRAAVRRSGRRTVRPRVERGGHRSRSCCTSPMR